MLRLPRGIQVLLTDAQLSDDGTVTLDVVLGQVVEQVAATANHLHQAAAAVVVVLVGLQMLGQVVDSSGQDSDLNLRRTGVAFVQAVVYNDLGFFFFSHHGKSHLFL